MRPRLVALMSLLLAAPVSGQTFGRGCQDLKGGTIRGVAIDDSTGKPVGGVGFVLSDIGCDMTAGSHGEILFEHVPPGVHTMRARTWKYRRGPSVKVEVFAGLISQTEFRLTDANEVLDCAEDSRCAEILRPDSAAVSGLTQDQQMREVAIRTVYAMVDYRGQMVMCSQDSSVAVLGALKKRLKSAVAGLECGLTDPPKSFSPNNHLIHKPSGKSAAEYSSGKLTIIDANTFLAAPSFYMNPLGAEGWDCRFVRTGRLWVAKSCRMRWIS